MRIPMILAATGLMGVAAAFAQPVITKQPVDQSVSLFADATFRVLAVGDAPLSYQWRFNGADLIGATNASLSIQNIQRTNSGNYSVAVMNLSGPVTSKAATLNIVPFNAIYCFGFSWTATTAPDWGPPDYFPGHPSNGPMWPEFMSTNLGLAYVPANNFARVGADSAEIFNQVKQLKSFSDAPLDLYVLWAGQSDILYGASALFYPTRTLAYINWTNDTAWDRVIQTTLTNNLNAVDELYAQGARSILVQNNFDLSMFPAILEEFGTNQARALALRGRIARFNEALTAGLKLIRDAKPDLRLVSVDIEAGLRDLLKSAAAYSFTKTFPSALDDPKLTDKSFTGPGRDYVFWDGLHGTSKTHLLVAGWNLTALTNAVLEKLEVSLHGNSLSVEANRLQIGRDYTFQKSSDLKSWSDVQAFTANAGTAVWSMAPGAQDRAYFRLKW